MFGMFKRVASGAAREVKAEYGSSREFLEGAVAAGVLMGYADGSLDEKEKDKMIKTIVNNPTLSKVYDRSAIEAQLDTMLKRGQDRSGRASLARELQDLKKLPNGQQMCDDVYLIAEDVAHADGDVGEQEKVLLKRIADDLGVDATKFGY